MAMRIGSFSTTVLAAVLLVFVVFVSRTEDLCFPGGYAVSSISEEFQSITRNRNLMGNVARSRVLRGRVKSLNYLPKARALVGELDVSVLRNEHLRVLIEPVDKDGFFIIDIDTSKVSSGLSYEQMASGLSESSHPEDPELNQIGFWDKIVWNCWWRS